MIDLPTYAQSVLIALVQGDDVNKPPYVPRETAASIVDLRGYGLVHKRGRKPTALGVKWVREWRDRLAADTKVLIADVRSLGLLDRQQIDLLLRLLEGVKGALASDTRAALEAARQAAS